MKQSIPDMLQNTGQEVERVEPERKISSDKAMGEIVGVFCDPIIVMPGGWGDSLPDWLKEAITLERLIENIEGFRRGAMTGTDAEACAYLFTASLTAPLGHDWTQIYFYVATKVVERHKGTKDSRVTMPEDIRVTELDRGQQDDLAHLKGWIYDRREKHRKDKARDQRKETKAGGEAVAPDDPQLSFDFWKKD